jgi:putative restriction endonuclease
MLYWWVNQKQTFRHEIGGGNLRSPKRKMNRSRNQFYENMKAVAPRDPIGSFFFRYLSWMALPPGRSS